MAQVNLRHVGKPYGAVEALHDAALPIAGGGKAPLTVEPQRAHIFGPATRSRPIN
ncbi:MAG: hypothetical protein OXI87_03105 [Albidovulum sp.]|nr:hypothetical protein [Albidovulum sp.]MDE0303863.1 hypothetical protein [Albidovulum sp.]MDE0532702.1 hypothetical protein [Albidovulum sp.]